MHEVGIFDRLLYDIFFVQENFQIVRYYTVIILLYFFKTLKIVAECLTCYYDIHCKLYIFFKTLN